MKQTIQEKLSALDQKAEFYAHEAEHARITMSMEERNEMRLRSPITMGELAWLHDVVSQVPSLYRQDLSCTAHDRVNDVVRLIAERVIAREVTSRASSAAIVVDKLLADLRGRGGLDGAWDQIDAETRAEIKDDWRTIAAQVLR